MKSIFKYVITVPLAATIGMSPVVPTLSGIAKSNNQNGYSNLLTVTFEPKNPNDRNEVLTGPRTVKVKRNWRLYMINKPIATKTGKSLLGWNYKPGEGQEYPALPLAENTKVTADITLVPVYSPDYLDEVCVMDDQGKLKALDIDSLCSETSKIKYKDGTELCDRGEFNQDIYIGKGITTIPNCFLCECTTFNSKINFELDNSLIYIGSMFMYGCSSFDQKIELEKCSNLVAIGNGFLSMCSSFNNGSTEELTNNLTFPSNLVNIGSKFLYECETLNSPVVFPANSKIQTIGHDFLSNCYQFKKDIDFTPLTSLISDGIEDPIMRDMFSFGDEDPKKAPKLIVPAGFQNYISAGNNPTSFTTENKGASCYLNGINLVVDGSEEERDMFKAVFPSKFSSPYRRWSDDQLPQSIKFINTSETNDAKVTWNKITDGTVEFSPSFEYSDDDGATWKTLTAGDEATIKAKSTFLIRGTCPEGLYLSEENYVNFNLKNTAFDATAAVKLDGNLLDLVNYQNRPTGTIPEFRHLFAGSTAITEVSQEILTFDDTFTWQENCPEFSYMFAGCTNLTTITLPTKFTTIPDGMFTSTNIDQTILGDFSQIKTIGKHAFAGNNAIAELTFPQYEASKGQTISIDENAFYGCSVLNKLVLTPSIKSLKQFAFAGCELLTEIDLTGFENTFDPTGEESLISQWEDNFLVSTGAATAYNIVILPTGTSDELVAKWKIKLAQWGLDIGTAIGQWQVVVKS